ncbi:hypothetical protein [Glaciimonas immobilis]|uniref:Uncharacterized protein n=1 Tax=Glaciimonas immobilis TaxID=728004 RepID=A0A840RS90_9BURK|nr:hypothetical protein [Glaciimonas immobilis]KAF3997808.1 hypothetical protein HAV38_09405 [Glaciimonas immobilis]MBB5199564.1 hypothetical protein [Glaciimonas immobilis]
MLPSGKLLLGPVFALKFYRENGSDPMIALAIKIAIGRDPDIEATHEVAPIFPF